MAQPPAYNREKNFTLNSGRETDHSALNAELDRASNSINDIRANLAILQADDGKLRPFVVTADSISEELRISLVEGVVMDAQTMLDESKAASEASEAWAKKAGESETAAAAKASEASASAGEAAQSAQVAEESAGQAKEHAEIANQRGIPVGTVVMFTASEAPAGYLKADGSAVGRQTYPELFAAIGTAFGEGDGETTFNLPDLIGRFAEGSLTPGTVKEAGLPYITGSLSNFSLWRLTNSTATFSGALNAHANYSTGVSGSTPNNTWDNITIDASRSNPIYGNSDTVQPPALTLLPCIKAFDAAVNPGLIDVTALANEVTGKADKAQVANLAMPSNSYTALTFPQTGTTAYTAPADGYFCLSCDASNGYIQLLNPVSGLITGYSMLSGETCRLYMPAKKGSSVHAIVEATMNSRYSFRFIYAEGNQP